MKSVGQILKQARKKKKKTLKQIQKETKIPEKNLKALESDNYAFLPPATFVKGFIELYAKSLDLDSQKLIAIFRRDWQKKEKTEIVPPGIEKSLIQKGFTWSPRLMIFLVVSLILTVFIAYFCFQIKNFFGSPKLVLEKPSENEEFQDKTVLVKGKATKEASVYVDAELVDVDDKGNFTYQLKLAPGENNIEVKAVNRKGKETIIERRVKLVDKAN